MERSTPAEADLRRPTVAIIGAPTVRVALELALEAAWFAVVAKDDSLDELLLRPPAEIDVVVHGLDREQELSSEIVRRLRRRLPGCRVVVVGEMERAAEARLAIRHGADGYVPRDDLSRRLSFTLAAVLVGQLCLPHEARLGVAPPVLSYREREVLQLAAQGLTNGAIAASLYLSESTVKTHLSRSFRKLGVASRAEAALALHMGGVELPPGEPCPGDAEENLPFAATVGA